MIVEQIKNELKKESQKETYGVQQLEIIKTFCLNFLEWIEEEEKIAKSQTSTDQINSDLYEIGITKELFDNDDSFELGEALTDIEAAFGIKIDPTEIEKMVGCFDDLIDLILIKL